jgi:hypothetical protein
MVSFGSRAGSNIKNDVKKASGGGKYLRTLKAGKDCRVRFLQDPEDWVAYREHYSQATKFFPCTQDETCPGCNSEDGALKRAGRRYISNVVIVSEHEARDEGQVALLKLPVDLANRLIGKAERNKGTLLTRDYTLIRSGNGLDTTYDVEAEDPSKINVDAYPKLEAEQYLEEMFESAFPDTRKPVETRRAEGNLLTPRPNPITGAVNKEKPVDPIEGDEPPFEEAPKAEAEGDQELTEDAIRAMSEEDLRELLTTGGVENVPEDAHGSDLADWVVNEFSS